MFKNAITLAVWCTAAAGVSVIQAAPVPLNSAIAYWQFASYQNISGGGSNDVADLSGNSNYVTRSLFPATPTAATVGNAPVNPSSIGAVNSDHLVVNTTGTGPNFLARDLSPSALNPSSTSLLPETNTSYTVFARFDLAALNTTGTKINDIIRVGDWNNATNNYYGLELSNGHPTFVARGASAGSDTLLTNSSVSLSASTWYDLTGVFDSVAKTMTVYVYNPQTGLEIGSPLSTPVSFSSLSSGASGSQTRNLLMFVNAGSSDGTELNAQMDLSAVWNTALSQAQVAALSVPVPEPGSLLLAMLGIAGLTLARWRLRIGQR